MAASYPTQKWFNSLDASFYGHKNGMRETRTENVHQQQQQQCYERSPYPVRDESQPHTIGKFKLRVPHRLLVAMSDCHLVTPDDDCSTNDDDYRSLRGRLQKSTSLKTRKKSDSNCEPEFRKSVRFADSLGQNLECIHLIDAGRPKVPTSAFSDLRINDSSNTAVTTTTTTTNAVNQWSVPYSSDTAKFALDFVEPFSCVDFIDRLRRQKVCLQTCFVSSHGSNVNISCIIAVVNVSFEKRVYIRYTTDYWRNMTEIEANYVPNSNSGWSDKFVADFVVNTDYSYCDMMRGKQITFAVRYMVNGCEHWDNNLGINYSVSSR